MLHAAAAHARCGMFLSSKYTQGTHLLCKYSWAFSEAALRVLMWTNMGMNSLASGAPMNDPARAATQEIPGIWRDKIELPRAECTPAALPGRGQHPQGTEPGGTHSTPSLSLQTWAEASRGAVGGAEQVEPVLPTCQGACC